MRSDRSEDDGTAAQPPDRRSDCTIVGRAPGFGGRQCSIGSIGGRSFVQIEARRPVGV
jgi:hypothetical protein